MIRDFKTDSAVYKFQVKKKGQDVAENLTGWKIIAEFGSGGTTIKKGTANVTGGADDQILITDANHGLFEVYLDKGETTDFGREGYLEVAALIDTEKDTLFHENIIFENAKIDWEAVT